MIRILSYIILGLLLAQYTATLEGPNEPIPDAKNWAGREVHYHPEWNKCYDSAHFDVQCPNELMAMAEKPE